MPRQPSQITFAFRGGVGDQKNARFTTKKCKLGG